MNEIIDDNSQVVGHIYLITNVQLNKKYVGQTLSHRKNRNKYRPFGYIGRFKDHISEAICNTKKNQCTYLNNAIRLYGKEAFEVELITTCLKEQTDEYEMKYIKEYNTLYPNGYNLTKGGKVFKDCTTAIEPTITANIPKKRGGCTSRSTETRAKMTESLKKVMGTPEARKEQMLRTQKQHSTNKLPNFTGLTVDVCNLEQYMRTINKKDGSKYIRIVVEDKRTSFVGKYETFDQLKERAIQFLKSIHESATLPN
uniref:GIY-YIG domain-containing protein n=1 Tax=viral metagenome TaxID=1070528 RepID=A0A6C0KKY4_9ZZZZ